MDDLIHQMVDAKIPVLFKAKISSIPGELSSVFRTGDGKIFIKLGENVHPVMSNGSVGPMQQETLYIETVVDIVDMYDRAPSLSNNYDIVRGGPERANVGVLPIWAIK